MGAPLIAITSYRLTAGRVEGWAHAAYALPETYLAAVRRAGCVPVLLPPTAGAPADELVAAFDGLLLTGGGDLDPARYGALPHPALAGVDPDRDAFELALVPAAERAGVPLLGICRGLEVVNVAHGGTLHQHLPDLPGAGEHRASAGSQRLLHDVRVEPGTRLAAALGRTAARGVSHHHQGIDRLGDGLTPVAWTADGLVEGVERTGDGWVVGVLWHPEWTAAADPAQQALFQSLADQAAKRAATRVGAGGAF